MGKRKRQRTKRAKRAKAKRNAIVTYAPPAAKSTIQVDPVIGAPFFNVSGSNVGFPQVPDEIAAITMAVNIAVFRCVQVISGEIGAMPWQIVNIETEEVIDSSEENNHTYTMAAAIDEQWIRTGQPFFSLWVASLLIAGKTFIEPLHSIIDDTRKKLPVPLRTYVGVNWLNPVGVKVEDPRGIITGFTYNTENGFVSFTREEIVYDRLFNMADDNEGLSPAMVAIDNITIDTRSKDALKNYYKSGAVPYALITPKESNVALRDNVKFWDDLATRIRNQHQGSQNAYRTMTVGEPLNVDIFDTPDLQKHTIYAADIRNEIYVAFGVPPAVAGDTTNTPYKDAPATYEAFYTQALEPYVRRIEQAINNALIKYFDRSGKFRFEFVTDKYDALRRNEAEEIANATAMYQGGAITYEAYQQKLEAFAGESEQATKELEQLPPMIFVPALNVPVPVSELPTVWERVLSQPGVQMSSNGMGAPPTTLSTPALPATIPTGESKAVEFSEADVSRDPGGQFSEQGGGAGNGEEAEKPKEEITFDNKDDVIAELNNPDNWENGQLKPEFRDAMTDHLNENFEDGPEVFGEFSNLARVGGPLESEVGDTISEVGDFALGEGPADNVKPSTATVSADTNFENNSNLFGQKLSPEQVASLGGMDNIPTNQEVDIRTSKDGKVITINTNSDDLKMSGTIRRGSDGKIVMTNDEFFLGEDLQGQGIGTRTFANQVENLRAGGVDRIELEAARGPDNLNGYYTWARFGYDADIPSSISRETASPAIQKASRVSDLMRTAEGRDWWKENGVSTQMSFDLDKSSQASKVFAAYLDQRGSR